jgi:hypothetical protein
MQCSNPQCAKELRYLRDGRVELLELEPTSHNPEQTDGDGFPVKSLPSSSFGFAAIALRLNYRAMENYRPCPDAAHAEHAYDARFSL